MKKILDFFSSIRLTLVLMIVLIILSAFGSFVSTSNPDSGIIGIVSKITGEHHQSVISLFQKVGLIDIYHSPLFISVMIVFTLNLLVCTFYKLPNPLRFFKRELKFNKAIFEGEKYISAEKDGNAQDVMDRLLSVLENYKISETNESGLFYITAERGVWSRLGVYIVHMGIVIILLSGILGGIFGYTGNIALLEGDSDDTIVLKDNRTIKLPFKIKLNEFYLSYYDNSTKANRYRSEIVISKKNMPDMVYTVEVNKPAKYEKLKIYQASYGFYPSKDVKFRFIFKANGIEKKIEAKMDEVVSLVDNLQFAVRDFAPSLSLDKDGKLINLNDMMINPAVIVEFFVDNESKGAVPILANYTETSVFEGFELRFVKAYGVQFSVFSINYNPFMTMIYVGFIVLSFGIIIAFVMEHRIIYARIIGKGEKTVVEIFGYRHRFKKDVDRMLNEILNKI
jgi:cytochrome c biogenesis protein